MRKKRREVTSKLFAILCQTEVFSIKSGEVQNCKELIYNKMEFLLGDGGQEDFWVRAKLQKREERNTALCPDVFPQQSPEKSIIYEALSLQIK